MGNIQAATIEEYLVQVDPGRVEGARHLTPHTGTP